MSNMWDFYKRTFDGFKYSKPNMSALDAFYKDAYEMLFQVKYTYEHLRDTQPYKKLGVGHDWNSALYLLEGQYKKLKTAYDLFISEKTEKNAENFSNAINDCTSGMKQARYAMWYSWIAEEYDKENQKWVPTNK